MFKKLIAVCALVASASFAAWDYMPALPAGMGQVVVSGQYADADPITQADAEVGVRYSLLSWLELYVKMDYRLFTHVDGDDAKVDGLGDLPFGARFQFIPIFNIFVDFVAPTGDDSYNDDDWTYGFGLQHVSLYGKLVWATEIGFTIYNDAADVRAFNVANEWDIILGAFVPYIGLNYVYAFAGESDDDAMGYDVFLGLELGFTERSSIDFSVHFMGDDFYEDWVFYGGDSPLVFNAAFFYTF